jgi:hypothetical protein
MINAQITLQRFKVAAFDGEADELVGGKPTGEKAKIKILQFQDLDSSSTVHIVFPTGEFEKFTEGIAEASSRIIRPAADAYTRNGRIKG